MVTISKLSGAHWIGRPCCADGVEFISRNQGAQAGAIDAPDLARGALACIGGFPYRRPKEFATYYLAIVRQHGNILIIDANASKREPSKFVFK